MAKGRPTKYTEELGQIILKNLKKGITIKVACARAGVTDRTFRNWRCKADEQKTKTPLKCFFEEVELALLLGQGEYEDVIYEDAIINRNVSTAKWRLANMDSENHGSHDNSLQSINDLEDLVDQNEEDRIFKEIGK